MLTSVNNFASPALTVMGSIIDMQEQAAKTLIASAYGTVADETTVATKPKFSTEALNHIYFGDHVSVTEAKIKLQTYVNRYLVSALDAQVKHEVQGGKGAADTGVTAKLVAQMDAGERASLRSALPGDLSDMDSAIASATRISLSFNLDRLSADRDMMKYLERMMGMDLSGLSIADIIKSFIEPTGKSAKKVNAVLSEGLAGQAGSKAMQRLEDAAARPKTVAEAKQDAVQKEGFEEVDSESKSEDKDDIDIARVMETLGRVASSQDKSDETDTEDDADAAGDRLQAKLDDIRGTGSTSPDEDKGDGAGDNGIAEAYFEFMLETGQSSPGEQAANYF